MVFCKEIKVFSEFQADLIRIHSDLSRNKPGLFYFFFFCGLDQLFFVAFECNIAVCLHFRCQICCTKFCAVKIEIFRILQDQK